MYGPERANLCGLHTVIAIKTDRTKVCERYRNWVICLSSNNPSCFCHFISAVSRTPQYGLPTSLDVKGHYRMKNEKKRPCIMRTVRWKVVYDYQKSVRTQKSSGIATFSKNHNKIGGVWPCFQNKTHVQKIWAQEDWSRSTLRTIPITS